MPKIGASTDHKPKAKRKPNTVYYLQIRSYPEGKFVSVWVCKRNGSGSGSEGLLAGELLPGTADALATALGLPVERDVQPIAGLKPLGTPV